MNNPAKAILETYIHPISSVLLVDENFPTYSDLMAELPPQNGVGSAMDASKTKWEKATALELWRACRERGWACDIENRPKKDSLSLQKADLIVLDYLLDDQSPDLALQILASLAEADDSRLVILYTKEPDLVSVRRRVAAHLRGADDPVRLYDALSKAIPELDDRLDKIKLDITADMLDDWLRGKTRDICERLKSMIPEDLQGHAEKVIKLYFEEQLLKLGASAPRSGGDIECADARERQWLLYRNLFIAFVQKKHTSDAVITQLVEALCDWDPTPLHLCLAFARAEITRQGFEIERAVGHDPALEAGLTYFALTEGPTRGTLVLFEKLWEALGYKIGDRIAEFGQSLLGAPEPIPPAQALAQAVQLSRIPNDKHEQIFRKLNVFLCSGQVPPLYLRTGTIIGVDHDPSEVWICVTPLCDLAPRQTPRKAPHEGSAKAPRQESKKSWNEKLGKFRAVTFVRAEIVAASKHSSILKNITKLNHVLWRENEGIHCASLEVIRLETMLVADCGRIQDDLIQVRRVAVPAENDELELQTMTMRVRGQLRDQTASMLLQRAGGHVSRIGVDFVNRPK